MNRADQLLQALLEGREGQELGLIANDLLREFQAGLSLERLRQLLRGDEDRVVRTAVWIASELGRSARPLVDDVARLLGHREGTVRYWAIDSLLTTTDERNGPEIAAVLALHGDPDQAVREKVMDFLSRCSLDQVRAALATIEAAPAASELAAPLAWIASAVTPTPGAIAAALASESAAERRAGAAAIFRRDDLDAGSIELARASPDEDIRAYVAREARLREGARARRPKRPRQPR
jgi:hypothetical protein